MSFIFGLHFYWSWVCLFLFSFVFSMSFLLLYFLFFMAIICPKNALSFKSVSLEIIYLKQSPGGVLFQLPQVLNM